MSVPFDRLQRFVANSGITQSAVRLGPDHPGIRGLSKIAAKFCSELNLAELPQSDLYPADLDRWTQSLREKFPEGAQYWGTVRKCINIFMRDAAYNAYLRQRYNLALLEGVLEVQLDGDVGRGLLREPEATNEKLFQSWRSIIGLSPELHAASQHVASLVAQRKGMLRVHLDLFYWRPEPTRRGRKFLS